MVPQSSGWPSARSRPMTGVAPRDRGNRVRTQGRPPAVRQRSGGWPRRRRWHRSSGQHRRCRARRRSPGSRRGEAAGRRAAVWPMGADGSADARRGFSADAADATEEPSPVSQAVTPITSASRGSMRTRTVRRPMTISPTPGRGAGSDSMRAARRCAARSSSTSTSSRGIAKGHDHAAPPKGTDHVAHDRRRPGCPPASSAARAARADSAAPGLSP